MAQQRPVRSALRRFFPRRLRAELYQLRSRGSRGYTRYKWRAYAGGGGPEPRANAPFDIGAPVPIVLHSSTVSGVRSHWMDRSSGATELDALRRVAGGHTTFLDIGAGAGIFSAAFCALTGDSAYAFEPSPEMFERITALIGLNPDFKITPFNIALGAAAGTQSVQSFGPQFRGVQSAEANAGTMDVETLDSFVARHELTPDLAKIDVEGMELEVLRGGAETFTRSVDVIMLEVHPKMLIRGESVSDIQAQLVEFGFELFKLDFTPIPDLAHHVTNARKMRATNIVCRKPTAREP